VTDLEKENLKLKMEIITLIIGYENELTNLNRENISDFSKSCMERYFHLVKDLKDGK
jgi:hypothetical protein